MPLLIVTLYITTAQRIVIAGIDFTMFRIIIMICWIRIIKRNEYRLISFNRLDKILIIWSLLGIVTYTLLWQTSSAFINRLGFAFDAIGLYFIFRIFIRSFGDIEIAIKMIIILSIPIAFVMLMEQTNGRNFFAFLGGIPEITLAREGRLRAQGAFSHPILAGSFGAFITPLIIGCWCKNKQKMYFVVGMITAATITLASASSGPVLAYAAGVVAIFLIMFRQYMRRIFWGVISGVLLLHLVMKAPVWHLVGRISVVSGSTGYHRYRLIDAFINHFWEWWLLGCKSTHHWGWQLNDVTNMYIFVALTQGGLTGLILFWTILITCFKAIGRTVKVYEKQPAIRLFIWSIGCSLFTHAVSFISVAYFGQIIVCLYFSLALSSTIGYRDYIETTSDQI